jgi:TRAP transporter TAXI family solute receptor
MLVQWSVLTVLALGFLFGTAQAQQKGITIGTNPPGTVFYPVAGGLASVINSSAVPAGIQPYTGSSTFLPLLDNGEIDFGIVNAIESGLAFQGPARLKVGGKNPLPHVPNARLIMRGSPLSVSMVVRKDSPIKTVLDVKGKRMTGEYPANVAIWFHLYTGLANAGYTWDDVKVVPVPAVNDGIDAIVQGRADVTNHAIGAAKVREADASTGVRYIPLDCSPQGLERVRKAVPGYYLTTVKSGAAPGVVSDTCVLTYDIYFLGHKALRAEVVQATLKAIWDNIEKLPPLNPQFKEWTRERAASADVTAAYHPAAVQFYKDKGIWTARMDESQKRLLAINP